MEKTTSETNLFLLFFFARFLSHTFFYSSMEVRGKKSPNTPVIRGERGQRPAGNKQMIISENTHKDNENLLEKIRMRRCFNFTSLKSPILWLIEQFLNPFDFDVLLHLSMQNLENRISLTKLTTTTTSPCHDSMNV